MSSYLVKLINTQTMELLLNYTKRKVEYTSIDKQLFLGFIHRIIAIKMF